MNKEIIRLYPEYKKLRDVRGLYLAKNLHRCGFTVYADFVTSLDGRIAVKKARQQQSDVSKRHAVLPEHLSSPVDLRLLLELQAQADCVVTHAGYLRARAEGRLGDILRVGAPEAHRDLTEWRREQSLPPQPSVVICSTSLDFPLPDDLEREQVWIATCETADRQRIARLREIGYRVIVAGNGHQVDGGALVDVLRDAGFNGVFLLAGPVLFESLLAAGHVDHLFITVSHQFVGTADFLTLIPGLRTDVSRCVLEQKELLYTPGTTSAPERAGEWFAHFRCRY